MAESEEESARALRQKISFSRHNIVLLEESDQVDSGGIYVNAQSTHDDDDDVHVQRASFLCLLF
jgi:hypothetical protein